MADPARVNACFREAALRRRQPLPVAGMGRSRHQRHFESNGKNSRLQRCVSASVTVQRKLLLSFAQTSPFSGTIGSFGDPDWIRTNNLPLRRGLLYPVEPRGRLDVQCPRLAIWSTPQISQCACRNGHFAMMQSEHTAFWLSGQWHRGPLTIRK